MKMSKLTRCGQAIKLLFAVTNVFIVLLGLSAIGFGIFLTVINENLDHVTGNPLFSGAVLIITVGLAIVIMAVFGLAAGWSEVWQLIAFYNVCASGLVAVTLAGAIFGVVTQDDIEQRAKERFTADISSYRQEDDSEYNPVANQFVDDVQNWFHCCGLNGPKDWLEQNLDYCVENQGLPDSCNCTNDISHNCTEVTIPESDLVHYTFTSWTKGCDESIDFITFSEVLYIGLAIAAIISCEVMVICCGCRLCYLLARHSRRRQRSSANYHQLESLHEGTEANSSSTEDRYSKPSYPPSQLYSHPESDPFPSSHTV